MDGPEVVKVEDNDAKSAVISKPVSKASGVILPARVLAQPAAVLCIAFSPDETEVVTGSTDGSIRLWGSWSGELIRGRATIPKSPVLSVAFSPQGSRIVSGNRLGKLTIWDALGGHLQQLSSKSLWQRDCPLSDLGHNLKYAGINFVAFALGGYRIVCSSPTWILDGKTGKPLKQISSISERVIALSPDGTRIALDNYDGLSIWHVGHGYMVQRLQRNGAEWLSSVAFSRDGARIIAGVRSGSLLLWDTRSGELLHESPVGHSITGAAFADDGTHFVGISGDTLRRGRLQARYQLRDTTDRPSLHTWNIDPPLLESVFTESAVINAVSISPGGERLASALGDGSIYIRWVGKDFSSMERKELQAELSYCMNQPIPRYMADDPGAKVLVN